METRDRSGNKTIESEKKDPSPQGESRPLSKDEIQEMLRQAVTDNDVGAIRLAVEKGADVNKDNPEVSGTPLHLAAEHGRLKAVETLLELGANIDVHSGAWATGPLGAAAWCDQCHIVLLLLSKGADVNKTDIDGHTAMHFAASNGCVECVKQLHQYGGEVRVVAEYGWTPLHEAASVGSVPVLELLLTWGAELNAVDSFGQTPLGCAVSYKRNAAIEWLRSKGGICKFDKKQETIKEEIDEKAQELNDSEDMPCKLNASNEAVSLQD